MEPLYDPKAVESRWQRAWEEEGLYNAEPGADAESFVIMHPPPNISGSLTIGHCLQLSLEDALVRWHRMRGFNTLFQPGYDHAGISTWASIGRTLAQELLLDRVLRRDARVVVAGLEEDVEALHPLHPAEGVAERELEGVAHVQLTRHVGRGMRVDERLAGRVGVGVEEAFLLPGPLPALLDALRAVERVHGDGIVRA